MQQKIKSLLLSYKSSNALTINILSPFPATSNKSCPFSDNAEYIDTMLEYCAFESLCELPASKEAGFRRN